MSELHLEYLPLSTLQIAPRNPKRHALDALGASVNRFGFTEPIILDERTGRLVAGHGRRETLLKMRDAGQTPPAGIRAEGGNWLALLSHPGAPRHAARRVWRVFAPSRLVAENTDVHCSIPKAAAAF